MKFKRDGLNIVPFIDVMLVLLAIVLSISTFIAQGGIKVDLPKSSIAKPLQSQSDKLVIFVDKDNQIYLGERAINVEILKSEFEKVPKETLVEIRNDKDSKFEYFIEIIEILKTNNHENFMVAINKNE